MTLNQRRVAHPREDASPRRLYSESRLCYALVSMDGKNKLYFGDNLKILRDYVPDASVDLIYLDPPFNSSATYNVLFKEKSGEESAAQIMAFEDTWQWGRSRRRCTGRSSRAGRVSWPT